MDVDILIGADFCFSFMTGMCIRIDDPGIPVALELSIGWVLTGPCKKRAKLLHNKYRLCSCYVDKKQIDVL